MVTFKHGGTTDQSILDMHITTFAGSEMDIEVGAASGMSKQQLVVLEQQTPTLVSEIKSLRNLIDEVRHSLPSGPDRERLCAKGAEIADVAARTVTERKWYSVSAGGLLEAAKAVGEAASPLVRTAISVISLLRQAKI